MLRTSFLDRGVGRISQKGLRYLQTTLDLDMQGDGRAALQSQLDEIEAGVYSTASSRDVLSPVHRQGRHHA